MADWSGNVESLTSAENAENLNALVEFLYAEAQHGYQSAAEKQAAGGTFAVNTELAEKGRAVATEGAWAGDLEGTSCIDCHTTIGEEFAVIPDDEADGYPTMAKYASAAWLKDFIRNPGAARHYSERNRMPAYSPEQITDRDLDLLVRWMTHDYVPTEVDDYPNRISELPTAGSPPAAADAAATATE